MISCKIWFMVTCGQIWCFHYKNNKSLMAFFPFLQKSRIIIYFPGPSYLSRHRDTSFLM